MNPRNRLLLLAAVQLLIVASIGGKLLVDRERYPRVWVETAGVDPSLPVRGRYIALRLLATPGFSKPPTVDSLAPVRLSVERGRLVLRDGTGLQYAQRIRTRRGRQWALLEPVAFFIPEHAVDPTRGPDANNLWLEVTVPPAGPPRPIRLGVRRGEQIRPL